eukprot:5198792-Lingulodinium_polyedra.AAC.1
MQPSGKSSSPSSSPVCCPQQQLSWPAARGGPRPGPSARGRARAVGRPGRPHQGSLPRTG